MVILRMVHSLPLNAVPTPALGIQYIILISIDEIDMAWEVVTDRENIGNDPGFMCMM